MNKKIVTAALAAVIASTSFGVASAAPAQHRDPAPRTQPHAQPHVQPAPQGNAYGRWQQAPRRYSAPRYVAPRGHQARAWSYGQRMPAEYRTRSYVVTDYSRYGLRRPPSGYQYVRSGNDVVLAAVTTGLITAVIAGLFN